MCLNPTTFAEHLLCGRGAAFSQSWESGRTLTWCSAKASWRLMPEELTVGGQQQLA